MRLRDQIDHLADGLVEFDGSSYTSKYAEGWTDAFHSIGTFLRELVDADMEAEFAEFEERMRA